MEVLLLLLFGGLCFGAFLFWLIRSGDQQRQERIALLNQSAIDKARRLTSLAVLMRQSQLVGDDETHKAASDMKYDGELPKKQDNGSWTSTYPQLLALPIAGINYRSGIKNCLGLAKARLLADPKNEFNPNAVKVVHESGTHIGFVPADRTDDVRDLLPCYAMCEIEECEDDLDHHRYFRGWLYINTQPTKN